MITPDTLRNPHKTPVLLCDWLLWKEISKLPPRNDDTTAWTADPVVNSVTYTNVDYIGVDTYIKNVRGSIERLIVDGIEYGRQPSVSEVNANEKTYHFNPAAGLLYVRPHQEKNFFDKVWRYTGSSGLFRDVTAAAADETVGDVVMDKGTAGLASAMYYGMTSKQFFHLMILLSGAPTTGARTWYYSNGNADVTTWPTFVPTVVQGHLSLLGSAINEFTWGALSGWLPSTVNGHTAYYVRHRVTTVQDFDASGDQMYNLQTVSPNECIVAAGVTFRIGSKVKWLSGNRYHSRLMMDRESMKISQTARKDNPYLRYLIGSTTTQTAGSILIPNGDGWFDAIPSDYELMGSRMTLRLGFDLPGREALESEYTTIGPLTVSDYNWVPDYFSVELTQELSPLDVPLLSDLISDIKWPYAPQGSVGKALPQFWGAAIAMVPAVDTKQKQFSRCLPGILVDQGTEEAAGGYSGQSYLFGTPKINPETGFIHGFNSLTFVPIIMHEKPAADTKAPNPVVVGAGNYDLIENGCGVRFKGSFEITGRVGYRGDGYVDDADGTFTGNPNQTIWEPLDILRFILVCDCKIATSKLWMPSFIKTALKRPISKAIVASTTQRFVDVKNPERFKVGYQIANASNALSDVIDIQGSRLYLNDTITFALDGLVYVRGTQNNQDIYLNVNCFAYIDDSDLPSRDVVNRLCIQIGQALVPHLDGTLEMRPLLPSVINPTARRVEKIVKRHQLSNFRQNMTIHNWISDVRIGYAHLPMDNVRSYVSASKATTVGTTVVRDNPMLTFTGQPKPISFDLFHSLVDLTSVQQRADEIYNDFKRGRKTYMAEDSLGLLFEELLGNPVYFNVDRAIGGARNDRTRLLESEADYGSSTVSIEAQEAGV